MRQKSYREQMFDRAWKLDLAKDERTATSDKIARAQYANALAYYVVIRAAAVPPGPTQATLQTRVQGGDIGATENRVLSAIAASDRLRAAKNQITSRAAKLIEEIFVNETIAKSAGSSISLGYAGANVKTAAVKFILRENAELLFRHFNAEPSDGKFHSEYIRAYP